MNKKYEGSTFLSVLVVIFMTLSGAVFLNCLAARGTLQQEAMLEVIDDSDIKGQLMTRVENAYPNNEGIQEQVKDMIGSSQFDALLDDYTAYISEYLLEGKEDNKITTEQLTAFAKPYVLKHYPDIDEDMLETKTAEFIADTYLINAFASAENYIPQSLNGIIQILLSNTIRNLSLILTILFVLLLIAAAMPKRCLIFLSSSALAVGLITIAGSKLMQTLFSSLSSNKMLGYILSDYASRAIKIAIPLLIVGVVLFVIGNIIKLVMASRNRF